MPKQKSKSVRKPTKKAAKKLSTQFVAPVPGEVEEQFEEQPVSAGQPKKSTYNPVAAKAYRDRLMEFAKKGGYVPKPKAEGTGFTEKRTSKTGTTYYYQPWSSLTDEQKKTRLAQARSRAARDRDLARRYREEHSGDEGR